VDVTVDNRLQQANGRRPHRLTRNEVPELARALTAWSYRQAQIDKIVVGGNIPCIRIFNAKGMDVLVRSDDWAKLVPYLKDGTLDLSQLPVDDPAVVLHPNTYYDASGVEIADPALYKRILTFLLNIFTVDFPTSKL